MVCSAWFRERLRKVSLRKENDMVQDIDIKSNEYYCLILMERL